MKQKLAYITITALIAVIGVQAFNLANAQNVIEVIQPAICTSLECEVERRTNEIFLRDQSDYMEQSRLKALGELNQDMMEMTSNPEKRLNK